MYQGIGEVQERRQTRSINYLSQFEEHSVTYSRSEMQYQM